MDTAKKAVVVRPMMPPFVNVLIADGLVAPARPVEFPPASAPWTFPSLEALAPFPKDKIAPTELKHVAARPTTPWFATALGVPGPATTPMPALLPPVSNALQRRPIAEISVPSPRTRLVDMVASRAAGKPSTRSSALAETMDTGLALPPMPAFFHPVNKNLKAIQRVCEPEPGLVAFLYGRKSERIHTVQERKPLHTEINTHGHGN